MIAHGTLYLGHIASAVFWAAGDGAKLFLENASDFYRHALTGQTAYADLDAYIMAISMAELVENYYTGYVILEILLGTDIP